MLTIITHCQLQENRVHLPLLKWTLLQIVWCVFFFYHRFRQPLVSFHFHQLAVWSNSLPADAIHHGQHQVCTHNTAIRSTSSAYLTWPTVSVWSEVASTAWWKLSRGGEQGKGLACAVPWQCGAAVNMLHCVCPTSTASHPPRTHYTVQERIIMGNKVTSLSSLHVNEVLANDLK